MASIECEEAVSAYLAQMRVEFACSASGDGWFLSTPFVRPDGEGIEIELQIQPNGHIRLSDMGDTLGYLYVNGLTLSRTLIATARQIAKPHGVSLQRNQLNIQVDTGSIGSGMHGLIQATLGVTDLIQKRRPNSPVAFNDEVESLIIYSGVTYDVDFSAPGILESHTVKFHVNSGRNLLIHPLSVPQAAAAYSWAERLAYRFSDIRGADQRWKPVAVLDDRRTRATVWSAHAMTPVKEYAIPWSERSTLESMLQETSSSYQ